MYNPLHSFFVRTPCFPFNSLDKASFETVIQNQQIQEAIYVASPVLYPELQKQIAGMITNSDEEPMIICMVLLV
jgi:hypothetical protein